MAATVFPAATMPFVNMSLLSLPAVLIIKPIFPPSQTKIKINFMHDVRPHSL